MENDYQFSFFQIIVKAQMEWVMVTTFRRLPDSLVKINQIEIAKHELNFSSYVPFN